ncbi:MAG: AIPR family protein [Verrucomicrobia bacterium]|nr:AIPR family protein [Verrucomicrobiota bacterium]
MDPRITAALERFSRNEIDAFRRPIDPANAPNPRDPLTFARLCVYLAVHHLDLPLHSYEDAVTEGADDCGLDGIAVAMGAEPLDSPATARAAAGEAIEWARETGGITPEIPRPRVLLVQSKRNPKCSNNEVKLFGVDALDFLTGTRDQLRKQRPNPAILKWWEIYDAVRQVFRKNRVPFVVETDLVFAYSGAWSEDKQRPEGSRENAERRLREALHHDRARFRMWGADELAGAVPLSPAPTARRLDGVSVVPLPGTGPARGFLGYAPAASLAALLPRAAGELDDRVFVDNVRAFLGTEKNGNPGAAGLAHTLESGRGEEVILKHNGITIVADEAVLEGGSIQLEGYQIVNGAQTSHVLHRKRHLLRGVNLPVKVVVTRDERLKDEIIRGANTQSPVDDFDFLSRVAGVRAIETAFRSLLPADPTKLWLQRRRGERLYDRVYDPQRIVTPRQLMEAFASAILDRPHAVHANAADFLGLVKTEKIFHPDHAPAVYLAMGWLVVAGRRMAARSNGRWEVRFETGPSSHAYPARFQFLRALWQQVDPGPARTGLDAGSEEAGQRFTAACALLSDPVACKPLENVVASAINRAFTGRKARSMQARGQTFAGKVEKGIRPPKKPENSAKSAKKPAHRPHPSTRPPGKPPR